MIPVLADIVINEHPKERGYGGLIRALVLSRGRRDNTSVEEESERRNDDDDRRNGLIFHRYLERTTEKQGHDLEHDGEGFHLDVEMPCHHPGHLPMSMPTSLYQRPAHINSIVPVEPPIPEHDEASGENRHRKTSMHRALNADASGIRELSNE